VFLLLIATLGGPALAQEPPPAPAAPVINRVEDIYPLLPPPGARSWDPTPVVAAVNASTFAFTPKHYYEVIDKQVPPEIVKAVAAKAAVFYDANALPLSVQAANARRGQPSQTINVGASDFVVLFEFFNDVQNDILEAEGRLGPLQPRGSTESVNVYEKRVRAREEALVRARGPLEGRIEATTFLLDLPASVVERDGCKRSVTTMEMTSIPIELFRTGMGARTTTAVMDTKAAPTIEKAQFTIESPRRFEVIGRCGTTGTRLRLTAKRTFDGKWTGQGGF
jgi:hypothetical protein